MPRASWPDATLSVYAYDWEMRWREGEWTKAVTHAKFAYTDALRACAFYEILVVVFCLCLCVRAVGTNYEWICVESINDVLYIVVCQRRHRRRMMRD